MVPSRGNGAIGVLTTIRRLSCRVLERRGCLVDGANAGYGDTSARSSSRQVVPSSAPSSPRKVVSLAHPSRQADAERQPIPGTCECQRLWAANNRRTWPTYWKQPRHRAPVIPGSGSTNKRDRRLPGWDPAQIHLWNNIPRTITAAPRPGILVLVYPVAQHRQTHRLAASQRLAVSTADTLRHPPQPVHPEPPKTKDPSLRKPR